MHKDVKKWRLLRGLREKSINLQTFSWYSKIIHYCKEHIDPKVFSNRYPCSDDPRDTELSADYYLVRSLIGRVLSHYFLLLNVFSVMSQITLMLLCGCRQLNELYLYKSLCLFVHNFRKALLHV